MEQDDTLKIPPWKVQQPDDADEKKKDDEDKQIDSSSKTEKTAASTGCQHGHSDSAIQSTPPLQNQKPIAPFTVGSQI